MTTEQMKSKFASLYFKGVNDCMSPAEDEAVRTEFREVEDSLMGRMDEKDFLEFYDAVHKSAWGSQL